MPATVICPACQRKLRLPDELLGKTVKCPACKEAFTVADPENVPPMAAVVEESAAISSEEDSPVDRPRRRMPVDDEDDDRYEDDYDDRPRRRRRGSRSDAKSKVTGPAIGLMVSGGVGLAVGLVNLAGNIIQILNGAAQAQANALPGSNTAGFVIGYTVTVVMVATFIIVWSGVVIAGSFRMLQLRNWGTAKTTAILAMIPCYHCFILGIPFGIWALVVLHDEEVRRAFR